MSEQIELRIEAEETENVLQNILNEFDDATLETLEINRKTAPSEGLASEPITIAVVIVALGLPTIYAIQRGIEKYLEVQRQQQAQKHVLIALEKGGIDAAKVLADMAAKNNEIAIHYGIPGMKEYDPSITTSLVSPNPGSEITGSK